jgi:hypothetical protein
VAGTLDTFRIVAANAVSMPSAPAPGSTAPLPLENGVPAFRSWFAVWLNLVSASRMDLARCITLMCRITADVLTLRPSQAILSCESPQDWCG